MKFASALTTKPDWTEAVEDLTRQIQARLSAKTVDCALIFVHPKFGPQLSSLAEAIRQTLGLRHLVGCTGAGIIGVEHEVEQEPAVSLLAGELPGVQVKTFQIMQRDLEESSGPGFWHFQTEVLPSENPNLILFADPFTIQAVQLVQELTEAYPAGPLVGGLASGGQHAGENRLLLDDDVLDEGSVGVSLTGNVELHTIVSQGCKPIGEPFTITRAEKNLIFELGGRPPLAVLQELLPRLSQDDQQLARRALFLGRVINEYKEDFGRGDFLIRNLIGHDPQSGAVAVGDWIRTGQTVQFQVRDGKSADEELRHLLEQQKRLFERTPPEGVVLFSCLGRGQGMYGAPNHDIKTLREYLGPVPTAGFFCNGEIGPVGERAFVHGFTSVVGLITKSKETASK
jgi:small ligand-binding sensory domain FIST